MLFRFMLFSFSFMSLSGVSLATLPTAQYADINYDVAYIRCPRGLEPIKRPNGDGSELLNWNGVNDLWLSSSNNIYQQPGCDLVLHKSDPSYAGEPSDVGYTGDPLPAGHINRERVLVDCDETETNVVVPICTVSSISSLGIFDN